MQQHLHVVMIRAKREAVRSLRRCNGCRQERQSQPEQQPMSFEQEGLSRRCILLLFKIQETREQLPASNPQKGYNICAKMSAARSIAPPGPSFARTPARFVFISSRALDDSSILRTSLSTASGVK